MGARLAYTNLLTASTVVITSSADATGYPKENLANPARWKKWRSSTTTGDQWVKFDLGSSQTFKVFAAINAVLHTGGTLKAQANATDSWGSPTVSDTFTVPSPNFTGVLTDWIASQSLRWIRFYFTNTGLVSGYVELGAAFVGTYLEPSRSLSPSLSVRRVDPSIQRFATGGQRSSVLRSKYHTISGTFVLQTATARNDLRTAYETAGATLPVLFAVDPSDASLIFYGHLQDTLSAEHRGPDIWDMPVEFAEDVA